MRKSSSKRNAQIMKMTSKLDAGPIWKVVKHKIGKNDTYIDLEIELAKISLDLLKIFFETPFEKITYKSQGHSGITYAKKITPTELEINWTLPAIEVARKINAFYPKTCAHSFFNNHRIRFGSAEVIEDREFGNKLPGTLVIEKERKESTLVVHCGKGMLKINLLQKSGGKWLEAKSFINGLKGTTEVVLGDNS